MLIESNSFFKVTATAVFQNKSNSSCLMMCAPSQPNIADMFECAPKKLLRFNKTTEDLYLYNPNTFSIHVSVSTT